MARSDHYRLGEHPLMPIAVVTFRLFFINGRGVQYYLYVINPKTAFSKLLFFWKCSVGLFYAPYFLKPILTKNTLAFLNRQGHVDTVDGAEEA